MKRFKTRKIRKKNKLLYIIIIVLFFFAYVFVINYLSHHRLKNEYLTGKYSRDNYVEIINTKINNYIKNPLNYLDFKTNYIIKTNKLGYYKTNNPYIYLYNTHQTEKYIDYNVFDATSYLCDLLNKNNVPSIFETNNMKIFLDNNNLKYYNSYRASLYYLKEAINTNSDLKYFFDIHRDSVSKEKVFLSYNNKNYAKILFIVGKENKEYKSNLEEVIKLNNIINNKVPGISRGYILKEGENVNGVYNQNVSKYVFLIEVGSVESAKEEVINTINILYESIREYTSDQL